LEGRVPIITCRDRFRGGVARHRNRAVKLAVLRKRRVICRKKRRGRRRRRMWRRVRHRDRCNWRRDTVFIGRWCRPKVFEVQTEGGLSVSKDKLLPWKNWSYERGGYTRIYRIKLRKIR
jgi:hypothetical protein